MINYIDLRDTKINQFNPKTWSNWLQDLPINKQDRISRLQNPRDRLRSLLGIKLLQAGMKSIGYTDFSPKSIRFNEFAKPVVSQAIDFSISHSGDIVICAISTSGRIGVDVEKRRPLEASAIRQFINQFDYHCIRRGKCTTVDIWTQKECIVKAFGCRSLDEIRHVRVDDHIGRFNDITWYLSVLKIDDNYSACVASDIQTPTLQPVQTSIEQLIALDG